MDWLNIIPLISQIKYGLHHLKGDKEGARRTLEEFASLYSNLLDTGVFYCGPISTDSYCTTLKPKISNPEWMKEISDSTHVSEITMPGTHNSGCMYGGDFAKCQTWRIPDQLKAGIRFLDIRCKQVGDKLKIYHGIINCYLTFDKVIKYCEHFLKENPSEVIVMRIKKEGKPYKPKNSFDEIYKESLSEKTDLFPDHPGDGGYKLGDVRGKIIILKDFTGRGMGFEKHYVECYRQDYYQKISPEGKRKRILIHHDDVLPHHSMFCINFTSACTRNLYPKHFAVECNKVVMELKEKFGGIIVMDFPGEKAIEKCISLNKLENKLEKM